MRIFTLLLSFIFIQNTFGQTPATTAATIEESLQLISEQKQNSLVKNIPVSNIGPVVMSGRGGTRSKPRQPCRVLCGLCLWRRLAHHDQWNKF